MGHLALLFVLIAALPLAAGAQDRIHYELSFPGAHIHLVDVEAHYPVAGRGAVELMMATWTPGSYLIRDYSGRIEQLRAETLDGRALEAVKTQKNRWQISTADNTELIVRYRVYCRVMSVRSNWVEADFAILNGAPTFLAMLDEQERPVAAPHVVELRLPPGWGGSHSGLPLAPGGNPNRYVAENFDTLIDSPIIAGDLKTYEFEVAGKKHYLVNLGEGGLWDGPQSAGDVEKIVGEFHRMWGDLPYDNYSFLNAITEGRGGLEHMNSTLMMASRWATRKRESYLRWLSLVSHEFFHTWNVKRLRPFELGPFHYETENYTTGLWIAEGFTSYYAPLGLRRAGLTTRKEFLDALSGLIRNLQTTPGRLVQPVTESSHDAWVKYYRRHEGSVNSVISYYTKGAVIAFLLDAKIRKLTSGEKSLDDLMRLAYERYSGGRGYTQQQFRQTASEVAGEDLSAWFAHAADSAGELDYSEALGWFGLRFRPPEEQQDEPPEDEPKDEKAEEKKAWLDLRTAVEGGRLKITEVRRGTPAERAGLNVDDELLAIDKYRIPPEGLADRLARYRPGDQVSLLVARRDRLMRFEAVFEKEPPDAWKLEEDSEASEQQKERLETWLSSTE